MQEIKKRRIVIASVLKPVSDTRMFEKLGLSLSQIGEVHIVGYPISHRKPSAGVIFHPTTRFARLSLTRMLVPWKIFSQIRAIAPHHLIITTHELLLAGVLCKLFHGTRLIYDVQENYWRNILYTDAFPRIVRPLLAVYVRLKELLLSPFVSVFIFAEKGYEREIAFMRRRSVTLENKVRRSTFSPRAVRQADGKRRLLFSGTLSESTGVFTAIRLATLLHENDSAIELVIAGYCSRRSVYEALLEGIREKPFITLLGGDELVPHQQIVDLIGSSYAGIVAYPVTPANRNSIPTKLYEYLAGNLVILCINHPPWISFLAQFGAGIPFNETRPDVGSIAERLEKGPETVPVQGIYWEDQETVLLELFDNSKYQE